MIPAEMLQDLNHDGIVDYLNARIYIADSPSPLEIAAAANLAARLAFETLSMDLPIGFTMSAYDPTDTTVAIVIGTAAIRFIGTSSESVVVTTDEARTVLAIRNTADAEVFARTLGSALLIESDAIPAKSAPRSLNFSLLSLLSTDIVRGRDFRSIEIINLAARIAFESTEFRLPLVVLDDELPLRSNSIIVGRHSRQFPTDLKTGQGRIEIAGNTKIVIEGADAAGESEALKHAAERLPYVWNYGKPYLHLRYIENDLRRFFAIRSESGQAAAALSKARALVQALGDENLQSAKLEIFIDGDCRPCLDYIVTQFPNLHVTASNLNVWSGPLIFEDAYALPWEVDDARQRLFRDVIPNIQNGSSVEIDLRVSESPQVRLSLAQEIRNFVLECGVDPERISIRVMAAHKQAYCWIDEHLKPRLKNASRIRIQYLELSPDAHPFVESPHRWLHELYPIDEVLSRDIDIPLDRITFCKTASRSAATYEVFADDSSGQLMLHESFEPKFVVRPMFDAFPEYAEVRVNTGWLHARVDGSVMSDERIVTDPERFWNRYQSETLPKIREYITQLYDGKPRAECAPHFGTLEVELWLSEPDYSIGIAEERISTLEALHEDIYFETLLFFDILGLKNPGRIIPRIHPARDGQNGHARIRFTGKTGPNPQVKLTWIDLEGRPHRQMENLLPIQIGNPQIRSLTVQSDHPSLVSLDIEVGSNLQEGLVLLETLREFHDHGVGLSWLSYEDVDLLRLGSVEIPRTSACYRKPRIQPLPTGDPEHASIVQCNIPIGPRECEQIIGRLASFPEVSPFHVGMSYLGQEIWALDVVSPLKGKFISQSRLSVTKPVLFVTGRQHANEVSSTSHILKFAECLATHPDIRKLLQHVNFILQPITNPDGAALVDELHRDTPGFMLHAGYLGSLGTDVTEEQWSEDPLLPEARIRSDLWKMWLPDIVLNPHGYPSHEWVQLFAGYTAWVKSRLATARDWWIPRGWFIPAFAYMESSSETAFEIRNYVTSAMQHKLGSWNDQMYRRYAKYSALDPAVFKMKFCNDLLVYSLPKGLKEKPGALTFMQRYPEITILEVVTEVPDEVAEGKWLETLVQTGLEFTVANAKYLAENHSPPEQTVWHDADITVLRLHRKRP